MQPAGGSSHGRAGPQGASSKCKSPTTCRSRGHGKEKGKGGDGGSGPSQPAVPPGLRGLRAAAAVAPAGQEAPAPQRLRMPQIAPPNTRQQWAEAYTVVGHKILYVCANAQGAVARADVLQAVQEFGALACIMFACRSGAAASARATRTEDGLSLDDARGEGRQRAHRRAAAPAPVRRAAAGCTD